MADAAVTGRHTTRQLLLKNFGKYKFATNESKLYNVKKPSTGSNNIGDMDKLSSTDPLHFSQRRGFWPHRDVIDIFSMTHQVLQVKCTVLSRCFVQVCREIEPWMTMLFTSDIRAMVGVSIARIGMPTRMAGFSDCILKWYLKKVIYLDVLVQRN